MHAPQTRPRRATGLRSLTVTLVTAAAATAQYFTDFESLSASPSGTLLTGQAGFYLPAVAGSIDWSAYLYTGNTLNVPINPSGGAAVFVAGISQGGTALARAQHVVGFGCNRGKWTVGVDVLANYLGTPPAADNLGSFSLQPSTAPIARYFIMLARWVAPATPTQWKASFIYFDASNLQVTVDIPGAGFTNLAVNQWYRWELDFDFDTNLITEIRLTDLAVPATVRHNPTGWYLQGGSNPQATPYPTDFRMFAGGSANNLFACDHVSLMPELATTVIIGCANPATSLTVAGGSPRIGSVVTLGVDNPLGTQPAGSLPLLLLAFGLDPSPCGLSIPGLGMAGSGAPGELHLAPGRLLGTVLLGPAWTGPGNPAPIPVPIPADCSLIGASLYAQGLMANPIGPLVLGLARAAELRIREG
jgi:hypothetical protein